MQMFIRLLLLIFVFIALLLLLRRLHRRYLLPSYTILCLQVESNSKLSVCLFICEVSVCRSRPTPTANRQRQPPESVKSGMLVSLLGLATCGAH